MDNLTKQVRFLYSHPLATLSNSYHVPMVCSWTLAWSPWRHSAKTVLCSRLVLSHASPANQQLCEQHLAQALGRVRALEDIPGVVREVAGRFHEVRPTVEQGPVWQEQGSQGRIRHTWQLWRELAVTAGHSLHALVRRWALLTQLLKARRSQHRHCRRHRRERLNELFDRAKQAASRGDRRELHKLVRLLSPRSPRKRLRLRFAGGRLMDLDAEVVAIQHRLQQQFASTPATIHVLEKALAALPFRCQDVVQALKDLPRHKAVPSGYVPTEIWKRYANPIGEKLWEILSRVWLEEDVRIPSCWSASWLCLIPKPQKSQDQLTGWRPIFLQDPCGKAVLTLITSAAKVQCIQNTFKQPQFAYLPGRSTSDAIRRVAVHVAKSLHHYHLAGHSLYDMREGKDRLPWGGGMQVFLDVESAFDAVPRSMLEQALKKHPIDPDLVHLFLKWYSSTPYYYHHHECTVSDMATTGIRQGCVAAPLLWDCHTSHVMAELQNHLGQQWVRDVLTLFADDFHLQWLITKEDDFLKACANRRIPRTSKPKRVPFVVIEGIDSSGKTTHIEAVATALSQQQYPVRVIAFPNDLTPLGRFLKHILQMGSSLECWTQHILFSLHRWEIMDLIQESLLAGTAVICE